jgi:magnesium-transporting ATPase (P-type)
MAVTTVIMFQVFYMLNCRSLKSSLFAIGAFTNPSVLAGILGILVLQAAFIYVPVLQRVFGTRALTLPDLATTAAVGAIIFPIISVEKWWHGRGVAAAGRA